MHFIDNIPSARGAQRFIIYFSGMVNEGGITIQGFEQSFLKTLELETGTFQFYDQVVIGQIREGMQVTLDNSLPLLSHAWELYRDKKIVYISDRKNSYSLDPTMHMELMKLVPFLAGYAWVVYNDLTERVAHLEARFLNCPTGIYRSMDPALLWARDLLQHPGKA